MILITALVIHSGILVTVVYYYYIQSKSQFSIKNILSHFLNGSMLPLGWI